MMIFQYFRKSREGWRGRGAKEGERTKGTMEEGVMAGLIQNIRSVVCSRLCDEGRGIPLQNRKFQNFQLVF